MAFTSITDKHESFEHSIVKFMVFRILKEKKRKCAMEFSDGLDKRFDVVDWDNGLVYEIIYQMPKKDRITKTNKYTKYAGIKDVIFIDVRDYDLNDLYKTREQLRRDII